MQVEYKKSDARCTLNSRALVKSLPGHSLILQARFSMKGPLHSWPPFFGAGLLHFRVRVLIPEPQVSEHGVKMLHWENFPSTMNDVNIKIQQKRNTSKNHFYFNTKNTFHALFSGNFEEPRIFTALEKDSNSGLSKSTIDLDRITERFE